MQSTRSTDHALGAYLRGLATADVMSAEEEKHAALRIADARERRWRVLLSYAPMAHGILALADRQLPESISADGLRAARDAADAVCASRRVKHQRTYDVGMRALARELAELDRDQVVADMVCADLESIEAGRFEDLHVGEAPRRTEVFSRYVRSVRLASAGFWTARNEFVRKNLRLVVTLSKRYGRGRMSSEDLIQEGNLGLMKAVDRFDPSLGFRFSTYGAWWIRHAITRAVQNKSRDVRLPVHVLDAMRSLSEARRGHQVESGQHPDRAELAERSGIAPEKIARLERCVSHDHPVMLDHGDAMAERGTQRHTLVDDGALTPAETLEQRALMAAIDKALADLPEIEQEILYQRFGLEGRDPATLREVGARYSLSRERIRQLQVRAVDGIRSRLHEGAVL